MSLSELDVLREIDRIIREELDQPGREVASTTRIAELNLDSISLTRMLAALEDSYETRLSDEDLEPVKTAGDLAACLLRVKGLKA
jgi:acyl carrier protein